MKFRLLALLSVFVFGTAIAVEVSSLYTAQVPLDQEQDDPRAHAYQTALAQVLLKVSGTSVVNDIDLFEALFPQPSDYVVQFRPGPLETIVVSFDGEAIEEALLSSGQPYWGHERPLTLVWLAVDWGQGEREILGATDVERNPDEARSINRNRLLRERILTFAESRGLPVAFPLLDSEDLNSVTFSDVWGGFYERVIDASERYDVNSVLIGRVRAGSGQSPRWNYHFAGEDRVWSGEPEVIIMQIGDLLAAEFSIGGDAPLREIDLRVAGINSVSAYGHMHNVLGNMTVVDNYAINSVEGDIVTFRVTAHGGAERLARALRVAGLLEQERIDVRDFDFGVPDFGEPSTLDFVYSP